LKLTATFAASQLLTLLLIDATDPAAALAEMQTLPSHQIIVLALPSSADGRAFSVLGHIAANANPHNPTWIGGDLLPDQATLAFQCGADALLVSEENWLKRGESAWKAALKPPVEIAYRNARWAAVADVSKLRQVAHS